MKKVTLLTKIRAWMKAHRMASLIIIMVIIIGGYYIYKKAAAASTTPQYVLSPARMGAITQTVTGSGQVSAENQLDVTSEVSGRVQSVNVIIGQHVRKGDLLATIDSHDAAISLEGARIAYAKLVKPAKPGDITNAENSLSKAYNDAFNAVSTTYLNLPAVMTGMNDMLYGRTGFLSDQNSSSLISTARTYRDTAGVSYDQAANQYQKTLNEYKSLTRSSATSSIDTLIADTYTTIKMVSIALQNIQNTVTYVVKYQPEYQTTIASSASANVITWSNQINSDISSLVSAQNTIASSGNSLETLQTGADDLDVQSQRLSLQQAEQTYAKYFIRAPFDGVVGRIPVSVYSQAGASTVIATIVGDQKIANISLNEVDAAKVQADQPVEISFDAIDGLSAVGRVGQVDLVGTVSQGVVSYNVRVIITTVDPRIKPGMSVNISIITKQKDGVLVVPSSAVKTSGNKKYVEVLPASVLPITATNPNTANTRRNATSTEFGGANYFRNLQASSTSATSTRQYGLNGTFSGQLRTTTVTSSIIPTQVTVTIGDSDDTNTEITSGLERGQLVITRTINSSSAKTATPNILSSLGGNRASSATGGGASRTMTRPGN